MIWKKQFEEECMKVCLSRKMPFADQRGLLELMK